MIDIEGASSERKNLVVLSLVIILFYFGGGHLEEGSKSINFGFVNLVFDHPAILAWFVWIALWWFAFRFFQASRESFHGELIKLQASANNQFPLIIYTHYQFKLKEGVDFEKVQLDLNTAGWRVLFIQEGREVNHRQIPAKHVPYILLASTLRLALTRPFFGSYVLPYLLFITANLSPFLS